MIYLQISRRHKTTATLASVSYNKFYLAKQWRKSSAS